MALTRNTNIIADKFYDDHLKDSANRGVVDLIREGVEICRRRHGRQNLSANTILYVSQGEHDNFVNGPEIHYIQDKYQSSITVPVTIDLTQAGAARITTGATFLYSYRNFNGVNKVYHFAGLVGGVTTDLNLRRYRRLRNVRLYRDTKWPNTRGWTAQDETVPNTLQAVIHNGVSYTRVELFKSTRRPASEGNYYYVLTTDLNMALTELWFTYQGRHYEL